LDPATDTVHVALGERGYDIHIGTGILRDAGQAITGLTRVSHAVIITDENVDQTYAEVVADSLADCGVRVDVLAIEAGEASKSVECLATLWEHLLDIGTDRKSIVVAVGGGVVGDLAGYVAASFARGLTFVQVPTTLLADVDSSVGGKVGINLPAAKNMVGSFWQPLVVLIDTQALDTLPVREYRAGLAEVVKYGVILDETFFEYLESHVAAINDRDHEALGHIIARCCRLKADVVQADERDMTGLRAVLNYGHTFCHAIEAVSGYGEWLHGEAVSIGMVAAARLAQGMDRVPPEFTSRLVRLLEALELPVQMPNLDHDALLAAMQRDKKSEHGRLRFILPTRLGHVEFVDDVPQDLVRAAFDV